MRFLMTYLRFHGNTVKLSGLLICVVFVLFLIAWLRPLSGARFTLLGDVHAPAVPTSDAAPVGYAAAPQARPIADPLRTVARSVTADLLPDAHYQQALLVAVNCARLQQGEPPLVLDASLSQGAGGLWKQLMLQPDAALAELVDGRFTQVSIIPLTLITGEPLEGAPVRAEPLPSDACVVGGTDLTAIDFRGLSAVGLAVFPDPNPDDGLDDSSAVIVAK